MSQLATKTGPRLWIGFVLTAALLVLALVSFFLSRSAGSGKPLPVYGQVADFTLTNQDSRAVSLADLQGHPWVADVIFTRCPGPCLKMSRQMRQLQQRLPAESPVRLVTLTTDPGFDTPPVLKTYAGRFGADPARWWFLTGPKADILRVIVGSLKLTALEKKPGERQTPDDLFIHSTIFVLVDKHGQVRGVYDTVEEGVTPEEVQANLLSGLRRLERES